MKYLLAPAHRETLAAFVAARPLVALDFDGTLAPIVRDPARAAMRPRTRRLLARLSKLYPVAVVSGRARDDVRARLEGVAVREVVGNHGLEPGPARPALARRVARWRDQITSRLAGWPGVSVEDKRFSLAVHYRASPRPAAARAAILAALAGLPSVRVFGGKRVVNLLPAGGAHKGQALERLRKRLACARALYVGDDDTDEDVFSRGPREDLLTVRVGRRADSKARFYLRGQREIDAFLALLIRRSSFERRPRTPDERRRSPRQSASQSKVGSRRSS